jgi:hypothetical protein
MLCVQASGRRATIAQKRMLASACTCEALFEQSAALATGTIVYPQISCSFKVSSMPLAHERQYSLLAMTRVA